MLAKMARTFVAVTNKTYYINRFHCNKELAELAY